MKLLFGLTALAAIVLAAPALASDARITIDGYDYVVPAPKGFCAEGPGIDAYFARVRDRAMKPGSSGPAAMLMTCGAELRDAEFYTFSVNTSQAPTSRADYLTLMRRTMPTPLSAEAASDHDQIARRMGDALKQRASAVSRSFPVGVDNTCAYAINIIGSGDLGMSRYAMLACATIVQRRVVYIFRYVPAANLDKLKIALADLPRMVDSIRSDSTT